MGISKRFASEEYVTESVTAVEERVTTLETETSELQETVNNKLDASKLPEAVNDALAQAKESGEFKGDKGDDGYTPRKGVDYFDGQDGKDGENGKDGKTPVKGTDYFTEADKNELVTDVLEALPTWTGGSY